MPRRSKDDTADDDDEAGNNLQPVELTETYGLCVGNNNSSIILTDDAN